MKNINNTKSVVKDKLKKTNLQKNKMRERVKFFKKNPEKSLIKLAIPVMAGMLVQVVYNITDTAFVGRLGVNELAAVTFSFPIMFIFIALANLVGLGTTTLVAKNIGANKPKEASLISGEALTTSIIFALLITITGLLFREKIFLIMGASANVLKLGVIYMTPLFAATIFAFLSALFGAVLAGEGDTKLPSIIRILSAILNLCLDAVFIYVFHLGVLGVSLATMSAFIFEAAVFAYFVFIKNHNYLRFNFKIPTKRIFNVLKIGLPMSMAHLLMSASFLIFNKLFSDFGVSQVAAYGLVGRVDSVLFMPIMGLSVGLITLTGMFYGSKDYDLIPRITKATIKYGLIYAIPLATVFWFFPELILKLMTSDSEVLMIAASLIKIGVFSYPLMVIGFTLGRVMVGLGDGVPGLVITSIRLILLAVPLAVLFTSVLNYGYRSIMVAILISGFVSAIIALFWYKHKLKGLTLMTTNKNPS